MSSKEKTNKYSEKIGFLPLVPFGAALTGIVFVCLCLFGNPFGFRFYFGASLLSFIGVVICGVITLVVALKCKNKKRQVYAGVAIVLGLFYLFFGCAPVIRYVSNRIGFGERQLRLLGRVLLEYTKENEGYLPAADKWCDALLEHSKNLSRANFKHPAFENRGVAFNSNLSGLRLADVPGDVVLLFESHAGWNLAGSSELLDKKYTNLGADYILLVNLDVEKIYWDDGKGFQILPIAEDEFKPLRWKP